MRHNHFTPTSVGAGLLYFAGTTLKLGVDVSVDFVKSVGAQGSDAWKRLGSETCEAWKESSVKKTLDDWFGW
ncbi:MAG: hypothetical protein H6822_25020 [Planctomycetaceae bacterium]|nr:hypothetical protein [Planctomycetales bacterium]MCB9925439.1 hypothetical protein [Planctomycetaceae bacterium]